jgi:hypothetical protein
MTRKIIVIPIRQDGFGEPTLEEILSDPITQAVMQADAVDARQLESCLLRVQQVRQQLRSSHRRNATAGG